MAATIASLTNSAGGTISGGQGGSAGTPAAFGTSGGAGVLNAGSITTLSNSGKISGGAGGLGQAPGDSGAGVSNSGKIATLSNGGTIGGFEGVLNTGSIGAVHNLAGGLIQGGGTGITNSGTITTLTNSGTIEGPGGNAVDSVGSIASITNSGHIDGAVTLLGGHVDFLNSGGIDGAVTFAGAGATNAFTNEALGLLTGNFTFSSASSTLTNDGHITGKVALAASDTLTNAGDINGDVKLGHADAVDFVPGGIVTAIVASTNDLFEFAGKYGNQTIDDFTSGTGPTHDVIQFAAKTDFATFAAVQHAMSQVGSNVVIRLDSTDSITLADISKSSLVSTDFKFV
jgi:hypothetical protein